MEDYKSLIEGAYREAKLADYMAHVTNKLVNDKKVLISVINHIHKSYNMALKAFLLRERMYRRVPPVPEDFNLLTDLFFNKCADALSINNGLKNNILKINKAVNAYDERGMLLERSKKYVFVSSSYELIDLKAEDVKDWLKENMNFVNALKKELMSDN